MVLCNCCAMVVCHGCATVVCNLCVIMVAMVRVNGCHCVMFVCVFLWLCVGPGSLAGLVVVVFVPVLLCAWLFVACLCVCCCFRSLFVLVSSMTMGLVMICAVFAFIACLR